MSNDFVFYITGIVCSSCADIIKNIMGSELKKHQLFLTQFNVEATGEPRKITFRINDQENIDWDNILLLLKKEIEDLDYKCDLQSPEILEETSVKQQNIGQRVLKLIRSHWFLGGLGCLAGLGIMALCFFMGGLPLAVMISIGVVSTLLTFLVGFKTYQNALQQWRKGFAFTMDTLFVVSTATTLVLSVLSFFLPSLPMMFDAGLMIFGFRHIGISIEDALKNKVAMGKFTDRAPKNVMKNNGEQWQPVTIRKIAVGDKILINPGDLIPFDGYADTVCSLHTNILDGSSFPRNFQPESEIVAGMRLVKSSPPFILTVTNNFEDSFLSRMDKNIEEAQKHKAPIQLKTEKILKYFFPIVIGIALISGLAIGIFFSPVLAVHCALSILVSACPCTLGLITPLAVKTAIHKSADNGIFFKDAYSLQSAEQIDTVILDLNGTLTLGEPKVKLLHTLNSPSEELRSVCYRLEKNSEHPIGRAVFEYCQSSENRADEDLTHIEECQGGIFARTTNNTYSIGTSSLMNKYQIEISPELKNYPLQAGEQLIYISKNQSLLGYIIIEDPLRPESIASLSRLKALNKQIHLCTGADERTAQRYAEILGIKYIKSQCKPEDKTQYIIDLKNQQRIVAMVGDAANDAEALAASNLGIAVNSAQSDVITRNAAQVVIAQNTFPLDKVFTISRQTVKNIHQNLGISLTYNVGMLCVFAALTLFGITLNPAFGVALMITQACLVLLNLYRFQKQAFSKPQQNEPNIQLSSATRMLNYSFAHGKGYDIDIHPEPLYTQSLWKKEKREALPETNLNHVVTFAQK